MDKIDYSELERQLENGAKDEEVAAEAVERAKENVRHSEQRAVEAQRAFEKQRRQLREVGDAQKVRIGLAFYNILEGNGVRDVLVKHCKNIKQHPAALARVLNADWRTRGRPLVRGFINAIDEALEKKYPQHQPLPKDADKTAK